MTSILKADTIQDTDGNNIINESGNTITIGASGDTISIPSGATIANSGTATGFGGDNTPMFLVSGGSGNQTISHASGTTITYNQEIIDTDNAFASNIFTVPSGEAGKYYIYGSVTVQTTGGVSTNRFGVGYIYKNGSSYRQQYLSHEDHNGFSTIHNVCAIMDLSVGDYIELYYYGTMSSGVPRVRADDKGTYLGGYKLIGV